MEHREDIFTRGKAATFEGQDVTGKTTQLKILKERLENTGIRSTVFEEPDGTAAVKPINNVLKNAEIDKDPLTNALLFSAARCDLWRNIGREALAKGIWVLSTRSYLSTHAYQGFGQGVDRGLIDSMTKLATGTKSSLLDSRIIQEHNEYLRSEKASNSFRAIDAIISDIEHPKHIMTQNLLYTAARCEMLKSFGKTALNDALLMNYIEQDKGAANSDYMSPDFEFMFLLDEDERNYRLAKRGAPEKPDTFESQPQSFQDRVNRGYEIIAQERDFKIISANQSIEAISDEVWNHIKQTL